jgi:ATP-dependent Clp protease adaptor protein ClpS
MTQVSREEVAEAVRLKRPDKYNVIMLNDESTPMDFVVNVLTTIFKHNVEGAKAVMLEVHEKGRAVAGTYSYEVAEQKCVETITEARRNGYPLDVTLEKND